MAPIHTAAENGNLKRIRTLLNQGVPVNTRNAWGQTPLHLAATTGRSNIVQELLRRGAHVNPRTRHGFTPLHYANEYPRIVHALIKAGANPKYRNTLGYKPSNYVAHNNNSATRNALKTSRAAIKFQNFRKKSIARKRASPNTLARKVFSPERVRRMVNKYGINYLNKV
jgi:ankyrin repeat protein